MHIQKWSQTLNDKLDVEYVLLVKSHSEIFTEGINLFI